MDEIQPVQICSFFDQDIKAEIIGRIITAKKSLKIAVAWFNDRDIFQALLNVCSVLDVELIIVNDRTNNVNGNDFGKIIGKGIKFFFASSHVLMHHKFCLIDDDCLLLGSYNWTRGATRNQESLLAVVGDNSLSERFKDYFETLKDTPPLTETSYSELKNIEEDLHSITNPLLLVNEIDEEIEKGNQLNAILILDKLLTKENSQENRTARKNLLRVMAISGNPVIPFQIGVIYTDGFTPIFLEYSSPENRSYSQTVSTGFPNQELLVMDIAIKRPFETKEVSLLCLRLPFHPVIAKGTPKVILNVKLDNSGKLSASAFELENETNKVEDEEKVIFWD